jgi:hypothetical protein
MTLANKARNRAGSFGLRWATLFGVAWLVMTGQTLKADTVISVESNACPLSVGNICFKTTQDVLPLQDYAPAPPSFFIAQAAVTASEVKLSSNSKTGGAFLYVSFFDTYTLDGPANLIGTQTAVIPDFHVTGTMAKGFFATGCFLGVGGVRAEIGAWNAAATLEQFRVAPFTSPGSHGQANAQFSSGCATSQVDVPVDLDVFGPLAVTYGTPFDVAYQFVVSASGAGIFDFMHTGVVSFTIPDGSSLTSVRGYSQGAPITAVPEPSSWILIASAALMVACFLYRPRGSRRRCIMRIHEESVRCGDASFSKPPVLR